MIQCVAPNSANMKMSAKNGTAATNPVKTTEKSVVQNTTGLDMKPILKMDCLLADFIMKLATAKEKTPREFLVY